MKKLVLKLLVLFSFPSFASDVRDYCVNVDQDILSLDGNLMATHYESGKEQIFHFESEDYSVKELKKVEFQKSRTEGVRDTHYAVSLLVSFKNKVEVPKNTEFNDLFNAAKSAGQTRVHFICRDYAVGSPVPPAQ